MCDWTTNDNQAFVYLEGQAVLDESTISKKKKRNQKKRKEKFKNKNIWADESVSPLSVSFKSRKKYENCIKNDCIDLICGRMQRGVLRGAVPAQALVLLAAGEAGHVARGRVQAARRRALRRARVRAAARQRHLLAFHATWQSGRNEIIKWV